jgi:WD40 repeat protein
LALAETRTWTDSTGKYKIEADFQEIKDGQVHLQRTDGKKLALPLAKLSKDDQAYLKDLMKDRRSGRTEPANPFSEGGGGSKARARIEQMREQARQRRGGRQRTGFQEGDVVEVREHNVWQVGEIVGFDTEWDKVFVKLDDTGRMVEVHDAEHSIRMFDPDSAPAMGGAVENVDLTSIRRIVPLGGSTGEFKPDGAPAGATSDWKPKPVGLNPKSGFFERLVGVSFARDGGKVAVAHSGGEGIHDDQTRIEIVDLKAGRVSAVVKGPRNLKQVAVSPSGQKLITVSEVETFKHGPLELWEIAGKELKHLKSWHASAEDNHQLEWIGWVDDERLMTIDRQGLTMWSIGGPEGEYQITGNGMRAPSFSPGGKQFAIGTDQGVSIHDVASGELLTRLAMEHGFNRRVAFSPSGKLIAASGTSTVEIYDASTGEKGIVAYCGSAGHDKDLCWLGEEHVLVGGADLIHLPSQMTVWTYQHHAENVVPMGGRVWYVFGNHEAMAILPFQLPHGAVKPVADSELVLKPGDEVSIQTELSFDMGTDVQGNPVSVQDQLKQALDKAGFQVVDDSAKKLVARTMPGETKEIQYRMFGAGFQTEKASYTQRVFELELVVDGESVWKRRRVMDAPYHLQLKENESVDQAINRVLAADVGFFRSTVPSRILPTAAEKARTSTLSINGLQ